MAGSANAPTEQPGTYGVQPKGWKEGDATPAIGGVQQVQKPWGGGSMNIEPVWADSFDWNTATLDDAHRKLSTDKYGMVNYAKYSDADAQRLLDGERSSMASTQQPAPQATGGVDLGQRLPTPGWAKHVTGPDGRFIDLPTIQPLGGAETSRGPSMGGGFKPAVTGGINPSVFPTIANSAVQATNPTQGGKGGGNVGQPTPQPTPYAGRPATQNINTQSAQGITSAMQGAQQEMGYRPQQVRVPGQSATIGSAGKSTLIGNPGQSGTVGGVNQSAQVQAGQLSGTNYDPYMNPYTDAVIKSAEGDILRGGEKALTGLGAQAGQAGAFGGSRHGIAMGEVGRNITEQMAKSATGLRQANFQQAQQAAQQDIASRMQAGLANQQASQFDIGNVRQQQLANQQASQFDIGNRLRAGQLNQQASQFDIGNVRQAQLANQQAGMKDIQNMMQAQQLNQMAGLQGSQNRLGASQQLGNLANLGFGMGQTVQGNLAQQGTQQQAMMQALIDAAKGQYGGYTGHPVQGLGYVTQALGATGTPTSTTKSSDPGLFGYLTAASQIPGLFPSDRRLKKNITKMGTLKSGLNIYKWDWKEGAKELGADMNHTIGVIAQEVKELFPKAVVKMDNGYYAVNYSALR